MVYAVNTAHDNHFDELGNTIHLEAIQLTAGPAPRCSRFPLYAVRSRSFTPPENNEIFSIHSPSKPVNRIPKTLSFLGIDCHGSCVLA